MRALQIEKHGPLDQLEVREVPEPEAEHDCVKVRIEAAALNPSDLVSAEGRFPHAPLPRILGRDFAGTVVDGPAEWIGRAVFGSGGDLGIERDGVHAEYALLPIGALTERPRALSAIEAATIGVPFVTAWTALEDAGLEPGETILISGAAGSVGLAAAQLAAQRGARVIALVKDRAQAARAGTPHALATLEDGDVAAVVARETGGRGVDVALNGLGAPLFGPLFEALAPRGRMVVYSALLGREAPLDLLTLYRRSLRLIGVNTVALDAVRCAAILALLAPSFESGALSPFRVSERFPLERAPEAYRRAERGGGGKIVLSFAPA